MPPGISVLYRKGLEHCQKLSTLPPPRWRPPEALHYKSLILHQMSSQHLSPDVKTFCNFEPQTWLEIITSRDAKSACFKGSRTSCRETIFGIFGPNFGQKRSHHVMDASCRSSLFAFVCVCSRFGALREGPPFHGSRC